MAVRADPMPQRVVEIDTHIGESGIREQSIARPKRRLFEERGSPEVTRDIRRQPSLCKRRHDIARMFWTPRQLLPDRERPRSLAENSAPCACELARLADL